MTYNVFSGTLYPTQSINQAPHMVSLSRGDEFDSSLDRDCVTTVAKFFAVV